MLAAFAIRVTEPSEPLGSALLATSCVGFGSTNQADETLILVDSLGALTGALKWMTLPYLTTVYG